MPNLRKRKPKPVGKSKSTTKGSGSSTQHFTTKKEKVLAKKRIEKKKGYKSNTGRWEPRKRLDCEEDIPPYENNWQTEGGDREHFVSNGNGNEINNNIPEEEIESSRTFLVNEMIPFFTVSGDSGFDKGLEVKEIIGLTNESGEMLFFIKWKESKSVALVPHDYDMISAATANVKCPQLVIAYYQSRLRCY